MFTESFERLVHCVGGENDHLQTVADATKHRIEILVGLLLGFKNMIRISFEKTISIFLPV